MDTAPLSAANLGIGVGAIAVSYILYKSIAAPGRKSSIHELRGPESPSLLLGHFAEMVDPSPAMVDDWIDKYGLTMRTFVPMGGKSIYSADPRVASYVLNNAMNFKKPELVKQATFMITGPGVFAMEGEVNRKQVRAVTAARRRGSESAAHCPLLLCMPLAEEGLGTLRQSPFWRG